MLFTLYIKTKIGDSRRKEKDIPCKHYNKKTGMAILVLDKTDFKARNPEMKIMIKELIQQ